MARYTELAMIVALSGAISICHTGTVLAAGSTTGGEAAETEKQPAAVTETQKQLKLTAYVQSVIVSIGALATTSGDALKSTRSDASIKDVRFALTSALEAYSASSENGFTLNIADLADDALLCNPRSKNVAGTSPLSSYIGAKAETNYMESIGKQLGNLALPEKAPTDIISALVLLLSNSNYQVKGKPPEERQIKDAATKVLSHCESDLKTYAKDFYGHSIQDGIYITEFTTNQQDQLAEDIVPIPGLPGAIGTLLNSFISILTPIFTQAAELKDVVARTNAIQKTLHDREPDIKKTGGDLAQAIDNYTSISRHVAVGSFVSNAAEIRHFELDLSKAKHCQQGMKGQDFLVCWASVWEQLQPVVSSLVSAGDSYDNLADANTKTAKSAFDDVMTKYDKASANEDDLLDDLSSFISLANAIANAASASNISTIKKELQALSK